jgi:hypothetical protein
MNVIKGNEAVEREGHAQELDIMVDEEGYHIQWPRLLRDLVKHYTTICLGHTGAKLPQVRTGTIVYSQSSTLCFSPCRKE